MAQITFNPNPVKTNNNQPSIGFFSLKNDGDEAIVRFEQPGLESFDILSVHSISLGGRFRNVNCLRSINEPDDACPLCKSGNAVRQRIFVKLTQYTKQADGTVLAEPKIWERPMSFAYTLKSYQDNYSNLPNIICKVIRHGEKGSLQTKYEVIPNLSKEIYTDSLYPANTSVFESYKALGRIVMDKSFDDLNMFVNTGDFPAAVEQPIPNPGYSTQAQESMTPPWDAPVQNDAPAPWAAPEMTNWAAAPQQTTNNGWEQPQAVNRPTRNTY